MAGNHDKALADYGASIRVEASNADGYVGRSEVFLQRKEWDKALADLKAATQLDNGHRARLSRAYESRGIAHLLKKDVDKAVADLSEAATLDPKNATAFFHRGASHAARGNVDGAIKDYSDSLRLEPENVEAYLRRGELYRELSSLSHAIADFDEAIRRDPKNVPALMLRALTREESGERDQATADYRVVLDIDPGNKLAKANLARLGAGSLPLPPERSAGVSDKAEPKVAALPKAATPGVGQFDGTWLIAATSETCKLRPDGSRTMTTTLRIANGVVHAATRVGAKVSGRVSHTGRMSGTLPSWADGQRVRFQGSIRGVAGAGTFSRSDGKCDGRFSMRRTGG
jgi:Flp pilus assembly protein TadD